MSIDILFVNRTAELRQFERVLASPDGQAILVVGQNGMGKTALLNKMAGLAVNHTLLKCGYIRYEVTPTDSVDSILALMLDHAFDAAKAASKLFTGTVPPAEHHRHEWLEAIKSVIPRYDTGEDLIAGFHRDPIRPTGEQFLNVLELVSKKIPREGRILFLIDPEKYMLADSDYPWSIIIENLPPKIKFIFAQRPDDTLANSKIFCALSNVVRIPRVALRPLSEKNVAKLTSFQLGREDIQVKEALHKLSAYQGHPYAIRCAIDLIRNGAELEDLPTGLPHGIAEAQWHRIQQLGAEAVHLFEAHAILEVPVPSTLADYVAEINQDTRKTFFSDPYVVGLLRREGANWGICHPILSDYILAQISDAQARCYHCRAIEIYRERLNMEEKPDDLAAQRLPEHILAVEGPISYVQCVINECGGALVRLGLIDSALDLASRSADMVVPRSAEQAALMDFLGFIFRVRGELDKAEECHQQALVIEEELERPEGIASQLGNLGLLYVKRGKLDEGTDMFLRALKLHEELGLEQDVARDYGNLALIYHTRRDLDKAEELHRKALQINERTGNLQGIANQYGNIALIHRMRGDIGSSEEMLLKSLEIEEQLGNLGGMASDYGNLGLIYQMRGELDRAQRLFRKALEIEEQLGRLDGMAKQYSNLGVNYQTRGDLEAAEQMHLRSLEINKRIGNLEGIANQYGNLGMIFRNRGDTREARESLEHAKEAFVKLGIQDMVAFVNEELSKLPTPTENRQ